MASAVVRARLRNIGGGDEARRQVGVRGSTVGVLLASTTEAKEGVRSSVSTRNVRAYELRAAAVPGVPEVHHPQKTPEAEAASTHDWQSVALRSRQRLRLVIWAGE